MIKIWFEKMKYIGLFFSILCVIGFFFLPATVHAQDSQRSVLKTVVLDPGHGGRDFGAVGRNSREKDIVLDVALRLGKMINDKYPDVEVIYTRRTDVFIEVDRRGDIANKANADLFISIHANSVAQGSRCPAGTETFVMGNSNSAANMEVARRENSVILLEEDHTQRYEGFDPNRAESHIIFSLQQHAYLNQSIAFAGEVQNQFKNTANRVDRSVKQANFLVLWRTAMPSVLVEVGFICNAEEERYMNSEAGKNQLAGSIFQAFSSYKSKIEDRSLFNPGNIAISLQRQEEGDSHNRVYFCIQIASSSRPMDTAPNNFKSYIDVERFQTSQNLYKYIVGRTVDYAAAQNNLNRVRADFGDAFIVSIVDGEIVPASDGLKLINQ